MNWFLCHKIFVILATHSFNIEFQYQLGTKLCAFHFPAPSMLNMILHSFGLFSRDLRPSSSPGTPLWRCAVTGRWRRRWTSPDSWKWDTWMWPTRLTCKHSDVSHVTLTDLFVWACCSRGSPSLTFFSQWVLWSSWVLWQGFRSRHHTQWKTTQEHQEDLPHRYHHWWPCDPQGTPKHTHTITSVVTACAWQSYMYLFCYKWQC